MLNLCISATASNQGKTILTTALLYHFRKSVRPFKIGPDFIDPQFHKRVCGTSSINLDSFIMNDNQVKWLYNNYSTKKVSILEGVMGFYDGDNKGCSAHSITQLLDIPTILILNGSGSYITVSAVLKGIKTYKECNTIKGVILNNISSKMHYILIKQIIEEDHKDIAVLGWIKKDLISLSDMYLGLDLQDLNKISEICVEVLENIDIEKLKILGKTKRKKNTSYPFEKIEKFDKKLTIINDDNFSFLYYDNLKFLREVFKYVEIISSIKDEKFSKDTDVVYICGGYVETNLAYSKLKDSKKFKKSLIKHSQTKTIYAECAGLLYLGNKVENKKMSGILDIDFILNNRFSRLGYYYNEDGLKGHSFHYTDATSKTLSKGFDKLSKSNNSIGKVGSWQNKNKKVFGTYLHTMFRNNIKLIRERFDGI